MSCSSTHDIHLQPIAFIVRSAHNRIDQVITEVQMKRFWNGKVMNPIPITHCFRMGSYNSDSPLPIGRHQSRNFAVRVSRKHCHVGGLMIEDEIRSILKEQHMWLTSPIHFYRGIGGGSHTRSTCRDELSCITWQQFETRGGTCQIATHAKTEIVTSRFNKCADERRVRLQ